MDTVVADAIAVSSMYDDKVHLIKDETGHYSILLDGCLSENCPDDILMSFFGGEVVIF